jgi:cation diffusion facilitator CzcD-associated flavoprotein CzcO
MKKMAQKWNLERDVKYNHRVVGAYWEEERGQWKVNVEHDGMIIEDFADILVSAQGFLK